MSILSNASKVDVSLFLLRTLNPDDGIVATVSRMWHGKSGEAEYLTLLASGEIHAVLPSWLGSKSFNIMRVVHYFELQYGRCDIAVYIDKQKDQDICTTRYVRRLAPLTNYILGRAFSSLLSKLIWMQTPMHRLSQYN